MHPKYPNVFSSIKLGPVELRNRFYSSPHAMPTSLNGKPSIDYVHYLTARAKGGLGLVMLSLTVPLRSKGTQSAPNAKENIPGFREVARSVHDASAKIFGEIFYMWAAAGNWQPMSPPAPMLAPSVSQFNFMD